MTQNIGRKLIFSILSTLPLLFPFPRAQGALIPPRQSAASVRIRVRLAEAIPQASIRGFDLRIEQGEERLLASAPDQASDWEFRCQGDRIRAIPTHGPGRALSLRAPVTVSSPAGIIRFRSRPYREDIKIRSVGSLCEVVNELDIEKYLTGLVNAEFSSQWNEESVQAQVIAARTYALYQIRRAQERSARHEKTYYDVDATVRDQVYDGYVSEDLRGSRAVERTRGMVLLATNTTRSGSLEPIKAFYSSSCAGVTELPENVWGGHFAGFKHRVTCPFCAHSAKIGWDLDLAADEIAELLLRGARNDGAQAGWPSNWREILRDGKFLDIREGPTDAGNRRSRLTAVWTLGNRLLDFPLSGARFRDWIGAARLKSTSFDILPHQVRGRTAFHFTGRGNGHGVGMCQLGAKYLGERGYRTAAILQHYYPDAVLGKLW